MNWWFLAAGSLSLVTAAVHMLLGGPEIHLPVQASEDLSREVRAVMAVVWHGVSAILSLSGAATIYAACTGKLKSTVVFIAAQHAALAALFIGYGFVRFGSLLVIPQWTLFFVIVVLTGLGLRPWSRNPGAGTDPAAIP